MAHRRARLVLSLFAEDEEMGQPMTHPDERLRKTDALGERVRAAILTLENGPNFSRETDMCLAADLRALLAEREALAAIPADEGWREKIAMVIEAMGVMNALILSGGTYTDGALAVRDRGLDAVKSLAQPADDGWKPTTTLPEPDVHVLTWCAADRVRENYIRGAALDYAGQWNASRRGKQPTHWRPLPASPSSNGEEGT